MIRPVARSRAGFALITVLWLIATLSAVVAIGLANTRLGSVASINRLTLTRARWAAEACLAIAQARWAQRDLADTATIDLGRLTRCHWAVLDPSARLNVNVAEPAVLAALLGDSVADRVIAIRQMAPLVAQVEMEYASDNVLPLTTDGPGTINANAASPRLLLALPGLTPEAVERLVSRRALGRPITSLDALLGELSPAGRAEMLAHYSELARLLVFNAPQLVLTATGWVGGNSVADAAPAAVIELLVVPLPERLAVIRKRVRA